jgi:hypothetical protein
MRTTTACPDHGKTARTRSCVHSEEHLLRTHLHDPVHLHHLWTATFILLLNVTLTVGVPILAIQLLVTIGLFGRDAIHILQS